MSISKIVTAKRMREVGLAEEEVQSILYRYELADARLELLREVAGTRSCENPDKYQADCGVCLVCRMRYYDGALREVENDS